MSAYVDLRSVVGVRRPLGGPGPQHHRRSVVVVLRLPHLWMGPRA